MIDILKSFGMKDAFAEGADFSGIDRSKKLFIGGVEHKAFVQVNEVIRILAGVPQTSKATDIFRRSFRRSFRISFRTHLLTF